MLPEQQLSEFSKHEFAELLSMAMDVDTGRSLPRSGMMKDQDEHVAVYRRLIVEMGSLAKFLLDYETYLDRTAN